MISVGVQPLFKQITAPLAVADIRHRIRKCVINNTDNKLIVRNKMETITERFISFGIIGIITNQM